jgi:hypothetical protein
MLPAAWELKLGREGNPEEIETGIEQPAGSAWG